MSDADAIRSPAIGGMTEVKVGRPSKARERRAQILKAAAAVVAKDGLAGATMARVAEASGLQRTLVLHYFGNRDSMVSEFISYAVGEYGDRMLSDTVGEPVADRLAAMFAPPTKRRRGEIAVWLELVAAGTRDKTIQSQLQELWTKRWLPALEQQIADEYPSASADGVAAVAYGLTCLFEAHWALDAQGIWSQTRSDQAAISAKAILSMLDPAG